MSKFDRSSSGIHMFRSKVHRLPSPLHQCLQIGFPVRLDERGSSYTVSFAGWHEEFDSQAEALSCFAFGLSEACRLRVLSRGSFDYRWIVQHFKDGDWHDDSETGLLVFPFWLRPQERYLQNHVTPVI